MLMAKYLLMLMLIPWLLIGCKDDKGHTCVHYTEDTPLGYRYSFEKIGTEEDVAAELDAAITAAIAAFPERPDAEAVAKATIWIVKDSAAFMSSNFQTWASGEQIDGHDNCPGKIILAYYSVGRANTLAEVPPSAPWWTVQFNGLRWWYADVDKPRVPALRHELGHALYGACFEHTNCNGTLEVAR